MNQQAKIQRLKEAIETYKKIDTALTSREEREFELWVDDLIEIAEAKADRDRLATALEEIEREIRVWQRDIHDNEDDADEFDFVFNRIYEILAEHRKEEE